jgi:hypothetical protein
MRATTPVVDRSPRLAARSSADNTLVSSAGGEARRVRATTTPLLDVLPRRPTLDVGSLFGVLAWGFSIGACFVVVIAVLYASA